VVNGQLTRPGNPLPVDYPGLKPVEIHEFQVTEQEKRNVAVTSRDSRLKPASSGILIETGIDPVYAGTWDTLKNNYRIWRCAFHVKGAHLMSLIFKPYQVKKGVRVFLYDPDQETVLGAFSELNNKSNLVFATGQIPGETIVVEVQVPPYVDSPGQIIISHVGCDFTGIDDHKTLKDGWFGQSGSCNIDINCVEDPAYQLVKNATVRIVFMGVERCSGTLLNNTLQDGRNYLLTAAHCIHTEDIANTAIFYFSYESPYCDGPDGNSVKSVSGATLRATSTNLDFSLLELLEPVPLLYHPYYAGWDNSVDPPASAYCIHHPQGDVKKISIENNPLRIANFGDVYDPYTHWLVGRWESGTTEAGSSGGGIFDSNNRLRGSLTGGEANCNNSVNDYFQMFTYEWNVNPSPSNQLAYWLDPLDMNEMQLNGFDPYAGFWSTGDTLSNIMPAEELVLDGSNLSWGSWSGHNSIPIRQFAEHYSSVNKNKVLGVILQVARNDVAQISSRLTVKIWQDQVLPGRVIYEKEIILADLVANRDNFIEFDSVVSIGGSFFAGYELYYDSPADTFSTFMAGNRQSGQENTAYVYDFQWQSLESYTSGLIQTSFGIMPVVFDSIPGTGPPFEFTSEIIVHPNPAVEFCWLEFKDIQDVPVSLSVFNIQGELIAKKEYGPYQRSIRLETAGFRKGIYIIRVLRGDRSDTVKMVVFR